MDQQSDEGMRRIVAKRKEAKVAIAAPALTTLREVRELFDRYAEEVNLSDLSQSSKAMYIDFASCFIRWMNGGFQPGLRKPGKSRSNIV
jgi:hypothetical protein